MTEPLFPANLTEREIGRLAKAGALKAEKDGIAWRDIYQQRPAPSRPTLDSETNKDRTGREGREL